MPSFGGILNLRGAGSATRRQDNLRDRSQAQGTSEPGEQAEALGNGGPGRGIIQ